MAQPGHRVWMLQGGAACVQHSKGASRDLCDAFAAVTKCINTELDSSGLTAFIASRLIPLDKQPGVRPIGISEIAC